MQKRTAANAQYGNWQKYNSRNPLQQLLIQRFLNTVSCLVEQSGALILADIGCAEGFVINHLQRSGLPLQCVGIDIDIDALRRARSIYTGFQIQQGNIYDIPYEAGVFDLVLCLEVLEHLHYPEQAVLELMRISQRYCLLSVPHEPFFRVANLLRGKSLSRLGDDIDHVNHWNRASFTRFLQSFDLIVRNVEAPFPWLVVLAEINNGA